MYLRLIYSFSGIQCVEVCYLSFNNQNCIQPMQDAVLAAEAGVDGILLSNHGGNAT